MRKPWSCNRKPVSMIDDKLTRLPAICRTSRSVSLSTVTEILVTPTFVSYHSRMAGEKSGTTRNGTHCVLYVLVLVLGLAAGALSGIIGSGSSIILLPVLVYQFGPKQAVPIMAVAALMSNVAKAVAWWRQVDWRAFAAYSIPGVPAAALGARTLLILPAHVVDVALGVLFLGMIPIRRWLHVRSIRLTLWQLALAGAAIGYLTGIVLSTGPLSIPAFAFFGLTKGALLSTEAASSLALMISKVVTFQQLGALPTTALLQGLIIGASVMAGAFIGKQIVERMSVHTFEYLLDALLVVSGLSLLWAAFR
jgi:uncharacterized membrane protein YfcA